MDRITLTPIIRGAYMETTKTPAILIFDEEKGMPLPKVNLLTLNTTKKESTPHSTENIRVQEQVLGQQLQQELARLSLEHGALPSGIHIPGMGSFFVGADFAAAEAARVGIVKNYIPFALSKRNDVVRGRIALVTGGAQGFGAEISRGLVDAGAFVAVADINIVKARSFVDELNTGGVRRACAIPVDVSDDSSVKNMVQTLVLEVGGLDLLVSNAGVLKAGSVLDLSAKEFDTVTKINYSAFFSLTQHSGKVMVRQRAAAPSWTTDILQINSKSGLQGSNKNAAYAGGKFGGIGLVQSFAMELIEYGIKVNAICPGNFFDGPLWSDPERGLFVQYLRTGKVPGAKTIADVRAFYVSKVPMGRGCNGSDVLKAIFYCVEQEYETGQAVPVTGGQVMLK